MNLTSLNLEQPKPRADYESNATTGVSLDDIQGMEQFLIGVRTHSGQKVTPEKARRCAAVLAIMRGLSEDIAGLVCGLYKMTPNGEEPAFDHPAHVLLNKRPNDIMTPMEVREHMMFDFMLNGAFYNLINEDPDSPGDIANIWPLQAGYVTRRWREMVWDFTDPTTGISGTFTPDLVWRGSILSNNGIDGVAISLLAREAIGLLLAAEEQAARLFSYGVQSDLTLTTDEDEVDPESKEDLRKAFMQRHSGSRNAWMPLILTGGLKAERIGLTAQESQYMEARNFQIQDVARVFRYPEVLLGSSGKGSKSSTYASAEQFFQSYVKHTLTPWATRIEQTANRDLLMGKDKNKYFFKHDFDSLLRGDTAARYASYATGIATGFMSPAQARRKENMPYVPGLDYFTRPLNAEAIAGADAASVKPTDESARLVRQLTQQSVSAIQKTPRALYFPFEPAPETHTETGSPLAIRVANHIMTTEQKAIVGKKQDADLFYSHFGAFVEDLTGADAAAVRVYLEKRRTISDRFSLAAQEEATNAIINLCQKDK